MRPPDREVGTDTPPASALASARRAHELLEEGGHPATFVLVTDADDDAAGGP